MKNAQKISLSFSFQLGTSPLHLAAQNNHLEVCELLIRAGISIDARTKVDKTPLHMAAYEGHENVVNCLVKSGADINALDIVSSGFFTNKITDVG